MAYKFIERRMSLKACRPVSRASLWSRSIVVEGNKLMVAGGFWSFIHLWDYMVIVMWFLFQDSKTIKAEIRRDNARSKFLDKQTLNCTAQQPVAVGAHWKINLNLLLIRRSRIVMQYVHSIVVMHSGMAN